MTTMTTMTTTLLKANNYKPIEVNGLFILPLKETNTKCIYAFVIESLEDLNSDYEGELVVYNPLNSLKVIVFRYSNLIKEEKDIKDFLDLIKEPIGGFQKSEMIGRMKTVEVFKEHLIHFTTGNYDVYDAILITKTGIKILEIKDRRIKHNLYNEAQLEESKYRNLQKVKDELAKYGYESEFLYLCHYNDGTSLAWNLDRLLKKMALKTKIMSCPATTEGYNVYVDKSMILLPITKAYHLKRKESF